MKEASLKTLYGSNYEYSGKGKTILFFKGKTIKNAKPTNAPRSA